jgi:(p)ppGpp synthase/HD superfamily hydrolase
MAAKNDRLAQALMVAIKIHAGQFDKQGEPYLLHILRVVEAVDDEAKVVAALHDVLEDGPRIETMTLDLTNWLGADKWHSIKLLTRNPNISYNEYIEGICISKDKIAREVKIADLKDNLGHIPPEPSAVSKAKSIAEIMSEESYDEWLQKWSGLKRRYEKAIQILEST